MPPNMFGKMFKLTHFLFGMMPTSLAFTPSFTRKIFYRLFYLTVICYGIGIFRRPYVARSILSKQAAQKNLQEQTVSQTLQSLDIHLGSYPENYFVIIAGSCSSSSNTAAQLGEQQLNQKQKIAFELNGQINRRLEINSNYFWDVKFLFIGLKDIYDLLQASQTIVKFYEKETTRTDQSMIYIFAREEGEEKMISAIPYKSDLTSILRIISKHKARKFASSIQF